MSETKERTTLGKWSTAFGSVAPVAAVSVTNTLNAVASVSGGITNVAVQFDAMTAPSGEQWEQVEANATRRNSFFTV